MDMTFPFESLVTTNREFGLVVGVLIGFCFGFVLERAGFGRSTKLAAQFYFRDMTVFKVMFGAIVTAMLGVVVVSGLGLADFGQIGRLVVSETFIWPMLVGGLLLGAGFIISGYCPGTSLVSAASGNLDGMVAFVGVVLGSVLFGFVYPMISGFYLSGAEGQLFIYELLGISPAIIALAVAAIAVGCFIGAERVEKYVTERFFQGTIQQQPTSPRRFVFASFAIGALVGLILAFIPVGTRTTTASDSLKTAQPIRVERLAKEILDQPWRVRVIDLRPESDFLKQRIPGSENSTVKELSDLGLQYSAGVRKLVLVGSDDLGSVPAAALAYSGEVLVLKGGFAAWDAFALSKPTPPAADASEQDFAAYRFQSAVHSAITGVAAPPPPKKAGKFKAPPKRSGGGCS